MKLLLKTLLVSQIMWVGEASATPITLRVMGQESIPPKWIATRTGLRGVCPDILQAIEKIEPRVKFLRPMEIRSLPFLEQGLDRGTIDGACALLDTGRRRAIARIAGPPLYEVRHRLAARIGDRVSVGSMAELAALKPLINTQRNASYAEQLRSFGLQVDDSSGDNTVNLNKIVAGHGRFFYINELTLQWMLEHEGFKGKVRMLDWVVREEPIYFHFSKKASPAAVQLVESALNRLQANGELAKIYAKWSHLP